MPIETHSRSLDDRGGDHGLTGNGPGFFKIGEELLSPFGVLVEFDDIVDRLDDAFSAIACPIVPIKVVPIQVGFEKVRVEAFEPVWGGDKIAVPVGIVGSEFAFGAGDLKSLVRQVGVGVGQDPGRLDILHRAVFPFDNRLDGIEGVFAVFGKEFFLAEGDDLSRHQSCDEMEHIDVMTADVFETAGLFGPECEIFQGHFAALFDPGVAAKRFAEESPPIFILASAKGGVVAFVEIGVDVSLGCLGCLENFSGAGYVKAERFLNDDVKTVVNCAQNDRSMKVVGGRDDDDAGRFEFLNCVPIDIGKRLLRVDGVGIGPGVEIFVGKLPPKGLDGLRTTADDQDIADFACPALLKDGGKNHFLGNHSSADDEHI